MKCTYCNSTMYDDVTRPKTTLARYVCMSQHCYETLIYKYPFIGYIYMDYQDNNIYYSNMILNHNDVIYRIRYSWNMYTDLISYKDNICKLIIRVKSLPLELSNDACNELFLKLASYTNFI